MPFVCTYLLQLVKNLKNVNEKEKHFVQRVTTNV